MATLLIFLSQRRKGRNPADPIGSDEPSDAFDGLVGQRTLLYDPGVLIETVNPVPNAAATHNGAPTQSLAVVRLGQDGHRSLDLLRSGRIPFWAMDEAISARCINAMCETVARKPAFRDAFRRRRCLVPADFFYERRKVSTKEGRDIIQKWFEMFMAISKPMLCTGVE